MNGVIFVGFSQTAQVILVFKMPCCRKRWNNSVYKPDITIPIWWTGQLRFQTDFILEKIPVCEISFCSLSSSYGVEMIQHLKSSECAKRVLNPTPELFNGLQHTIFGMIYRNC